jgi:hypothetical protein
MCVRMFLQELGRRMQEGRDGSEGELVWQLCGVEAGSRVEGLAVRCVDEVGRPAAGGVRGRIQVGAGRRLANIQVLSTCCGW